MTKLYELWFLLITFLFYSSCATTSQMQPVSKGQIIDMGIYTVKAPLGDGWKVEIAKERMRVTFMNKPGSFLGGRLPIIVIDVAQNRVMQKNWNLTEEETANDYRNGEEADMMMRGVLPGNYELHDVEKNTMTFEGKKLYTMSYKTMGGKWFDPDKEQKATLFLYFPPDFGEKRIFYTFLISEVKAKGTIRETDSTLILSCY